MIEPSLKTTCPRCGTDSTFDSGNTEIIVFGQHTIVAKVWCCKNGCRNFHGRIYEPASCQQISDAVIQQFIEHDGRGSEMK